MDRSQFTPEELRLMDYLYRSPKINKRTVGGIISDIEDQVDNMSLKMHSPTTPRLEKNQLRVRIHGRRYYISQLKNQFGL